MPTDPRIVRTGACVATIADKAAVFQARCGAASTTVTGLKALLSNNISR
jgi:hypothetical protein